RLAREIHIMSKVSHPNIISFTGFHLDRKDLRMACVIAPYMANGNVGEYLDDNDSLLRHAAQLWDIATGVEYLHTYCPPILHGDLKSPNVVVNEEGHAEIIDFGTARFTEYADDPLYAVRWASPEMLLNSDVSLESDIWALGWTFWEVVTGKIPHAEVTNDMAVVVKTITEASSKWADANDLQIQSLRDLLIDCWQKDPKRRPKASECRGALRYMVRIKASTFFILLMHFVS
ncbi:hypothetical protein M407DRAFT_73459, partial [Tulasnella calospora MUT 4182]